MSKSLKTSFEKEIRNKAPKSNKNVKISFLKKIKNWLFKIYGSGITLTNKEIKDIIKVLRK